MKNDDMILKISNLTKTIESNVILDNLSFSLPKGKILAILGPNGAGKTTLIRIILGLYMKDKGSVSIFGQEVNQTNFPAIRQQIGVQNDGNIYEELTVYDNLSIWAKLYGVNEADIDDRVDELLDFFDLSTKKFKLAGTLSKGMKQKVNLGRAIFHKPKLLILDEPSSGLDPLSIQSLMKLLQKIAHKYGVSIIMCTHQLSGLERVADYIGIINHGNFIAYGETEKLLKQEWAESEFLMDVKPMNRALELCSKKWNCTVSNGELSIKISDNSIPEIVKYLVTNDIDIYKIARTEHTINELYAKYIEGEKD